MLNAPEFGRRPVARHADPHGYAWPPTSRRRLPPQPRRRRSSLSLKHATSTYRWAAWGDLNAFFGLMLDNLTNLVILTGILAGGFQFPAEIVFTHMIPGTALGVLVGDLIYA